MMSKDTKSSDAEWLKVCNSHTNNADLVSFANVTRKQIDLNALQTVGIFSQIFATQWSGRLYLPSSQLTVVEKKTSLWLKSTVQVAHIIYYHVFSNVCEINGHDTAHMLTLLVHGKRWHDHRLVTPAISRWQSWHRHSVRHLQLTQLVHQLTTVGPRENTTLRVWR